MENKELERLAKRLSLIELENEVEEYVLTSEEELTAINNAINAKKQYVSWKMKGLGYVEAQIVQKILEIDWDKEIDKRDILLKSNSNKLQDLWHKEQRIKEKERKQREYKELLEKCTAKYMFNLMKWTSRNVFEKDLIINEDNTPLIKALCFFLSNDERFESECGFSFRKGLIIRGISGIGKTHLVQCVSKNELNPIFILSMIDVAEKIKLEGEIEINLGSNKILYLDDVGTEEATINHYGTKINFFKNFVESYYLKNKIFNKLIISTNINFSEMEERYGFRVRSRMKDMFNVIDISGKDMRG